MKKRTRDRQLDMEKNYSIFDNMLEGCQIISYDWQYLYVNDAAVKQCRVEKDDLLGKRVMEVYPGIEKTKLFSNLQKSMKERVSVSMENELTFPSGSKGWFELKIEPVPEGIFVLSIDITKRKTAKEELRKVHGNLQEEVDDINALHQLSTKFIEGDDLNSILHEVLNVVINITGADKGNIQFIDHSTGNLKIVANKHFSPYFLKFFESIPPGGSASCGIAMERLERVVVEDVTKSPIFHGDSLEMMLREGIKAVQSTPLISRDGELIGIISTHFNKVHSPAERELKFIDILARQAADIIQRKYAEEELKRHGKLLEGINQALHGSLILETEEEVAGKCLEVAEGLTDSEFGFLGEINPNGRLDTLALSPLAWKAFKISPEKTRGTVTNMEIVSYWGRTIKEEKSQIVNDPESDVNRRGFPGGHPKIASFLGVPLKQRNDTIGMIALANKEDGYTTEDMKNIEALSVAFVEALMRKRAEIELKGSYDVLEKKVEERTAELEKAYTELKESEDKFYKAFHDNPAAMTLSDAKGKYIDVNESFSKLTGYSKDELIGCTSVELNIIDLEKCKQYMAELHEKGSKRDVEFEIQTKSREKRTIINSSEAIELGSETRFISFIYDISERKKAEEQINQYKDQLEDLVKKLKESKAHFKSLSENSPDLIIRIDNEFNYLYVNPTITKFTGKPPEFFIGKNIEEIEISEEYTSLWKEKYQKTFKTGKIQHMEIEFHTISGLKFFERITVPEFNDEGEIETVLSISRDITERKEAEKKLEEIIGELKRSNEELQRFAYVASHDLQEPLRTVSSFTQLLKRRYESRLDKDADEFIEYIVEAAQRMQQMIHDLLDYSRIMTKGKEFEEVNSENILKEVISSLKIIIDENNALISYDKLPTIVADSGQLRRVFQNLIVNAIKFQKPDESPKIHISVRKDQERNEYVFSVSDNGIGIEKQYFDRIFTIFQRLHAKDEYQGTGIGLSIVKRIIERHGGQMWVESEPGVGSTFYFTISSS